MATLTSTAATSKESAIAGMAGTMIVASRISMKNAPATSNAIPLGNEGDGVDSAPASAPASDMASKPRRRPIVQLAGHWSA